MSAALRIAAGALTGTLFGAGLGISGMNDPHKVLAFLDVAGAWDPSLALVMAGALAVAVPGFRLVLRRPRPLLDERLHLPTRRDIDAALVLGSLLFGIGWGLAGYCPGPAIANLATGNAEVWFFVPAMLAGGWLQRWWQRRRAAPAAATAAQKKS
ncbi:DUF6691 family protein [Rubrivivax gelatinosus]|uniref:YeeE/YedE family protein n=1 Tax=Rubrivivax gelatinosus TaxID=28068 RepID=A0ABS1E245_RUBGE|nr:YeeE/YedE family protein [Rubrivivax gelatinosus]